MKNLGIEIERKFLVIEEKLPELLNGKYISQGYIQTKDLTVVRARIKGDKGFLTIKGKNTGTSCLEYEYDIPISEAKETIENLCQGKSVEKTRFELKIGQHIWELDVFHGLNKGLVVAEIELSNENEEFERPSWIGEEVSGDSRYYNSKLLYTPYSTWDKAQD